MSQCYIHANLVKIHPPVHEISCKQESVTLMLTPSLTPKQQDPHQKQYVPLPFSGRHNYYALTLCLECKDVLLKQMTSNWSRWHPLLGLPYATLSSWQQLQVAFLNHWFFLAWAYSIPLVCHLSVVVHTFKLEYLWSQLANLDQILCVASLGWGKCCIRFCGRLDQNSGFHGNRKPQLTYNGEKRCCCLFPVLFGPIFLIFVDNKDMHKILDEFEFWPDRTTDSGVSCLWVLNNFT